MRGVYCGYKRQLLAQSVTSFIPTRGRGERRWALARAGWLARAAGLDEGDNPGRSCPAARRPPGTLARQPRGRTRTGFGRSGKTEILPDAEALIGITSDEDASRWYPMGTAAGVDAGAVQRGTARGRAALELQYNDVLAGKPGKMITEVDARARTLPGRGDAPTCPPSREHPAADHRPGRSGRRGASRARMCAGQRRGERSGNRHGREHRCAARHGDAPDSNDPANPPRDDLDRLNELMRLTVLSDVYEPGSTFKMLTAAAAIDCQGRQARRRAFTARAGSRWTAARFAAGVRRTARRR